MRFPALKHILLAVGACYAIISPMNAFAHGGVKLEQDECVLKIGPNTMHFIGYELNGEEQEFCEDIAKTGPTVIALTAVSPDLRDMAIGIAWSKISARRRRKPIRLCDRRLFSAESLPERHDDVPA